MRIHCTCTVCHQSKTDATSRELGSSTAAFDDDIAETTDRSDVSDTVPTYVRTFARPRNNSCERTGCTRDSNTHTTRHPQKTPGMQRYHQPALRYCEVLIASTGQRMVSIWVAKDTDFCINRANVKRPDPLYQWSLKSTLAQVLCVPRYSSQLFFESEVDISPHKIMSQHLVSTQRQQQATQRRVLALDSKLKALNAHTRLLRAVVHSEGGFNVSFGLKGIFSGNTSIPSVMIRSCNLFSCYKERDQGASTNLKAPTHKQRY